MIKKIDTAGIAQLLGYSRTYVTDKVTKRPDFPKPVIALNQKHKFWNESDVIQWVEKVSQAA